MIREKAWYRLILRIADIYNKIINFICVILLTAQTISILVMVFGRYRDDSHVKMEVVDNLVSKEVLLGFKLFGMLCNIAFGVIMVVFGTKLSILTWPTKLSALRISTGIQYYSSVAGGFFIITNALVFCVEMLVNHHDDKLGEKEAETA